MGGGVRPAPNILRGPSVETCTIWIKRLQNGYTLRITDPEIVKQNKARTNTKDGCCAPGWKDPEVEYAFDGADQLVEFLEANLEKALPVDDYTASFDAAVKESKRERD